MADDTDLNLDDLEEDEVRATDSKEEDIEEVFAEDEQTEITSRELEAVYDSCPSISCSWQADYASEPTPKTWKRCGG